MHSHVRMEHTSEYFCQLSEAEKKQYKENVLSCGLKNDLYAIEDGLEELLDDIPYVHWSDLTLFMVSTQSTHTKESLEVKVK